MSSTADMAEAGVLIVSGWVDWSEPEWVVRVGVDGVWAGGRWACQGRGRACQGPAVLHTSHCMHAFLRPHPVGTTSTFLCFPPSCCLFFPRIDLPNPC